MGRLAEWEAEWAAERAAKAARLAAVKAAYPDGRNGVRIGDVIEFVRHGTLPSSGRSRNHRDGGLEDGISVYHLVESEVRYVGFWFGIAAKPAYRGRGEVVGFGSDGEPVVEVLGTVRRAPEFDREE